MNGQTAKKLRKLALVMEGSYKSDYKAIKRVFKIKDKNGDDKEINRYQLLTKGWRARYKKLKKAYYKEIRNGN